MLSYSEGKHPDIPEHQPTLESLTRLKEIGKSGHRKRKHPEGDLQIACLGWFKMQYRKYQNNIFAIPNQLARRGRNAQFAAKQGVLSGVPDLMLAVPTKNYAGAFIEMKAEKGKLSPHQKEMIQLLSDSGYYCAVCHSFDKFKEEIDKYLMK